MNKAPAFQFYPKDLLSDHDFLSLSCEERGALFSLLLHEWCNSGLPLDDGELARYSSANERWDSVRDRVMAFFKKTGGKKSKWVNPHLQSQRKQQRERRAKQKQSGKQGAIVRWSKEGGKSTPKSEQSGGGVSKSRTDNSLSANNDDSKCHNESMANAMTNYSSAVCSLHTADKEKIDCSPLPPTDVGSGCSEFEARLLPSYQAVLDAWREERGKAELAYVPDPQTKDGAARLAAMIERGETAEGDVRKAMANLLSDTEARERYTLKGLSNNLSLWIDGGKRGGKGGNGRPRRGGPPDQGTLLEKGAKAFEGL
jgi:uncharacterized protein YdaU (DUF1376 family)